MREEGKKEKRGRERWRRGVERGDRDGWAGE